MTRRWYRFTAFVVLAVGLGIAGTAGAYHSYVLSVAQLRMGLDKSSSPSQKGFFLIDVRSPEEHAAGVIPGTDMNIDFREIKARHREIGAKPDDHIVVYCQSGHRSNIAAETLADLGYKHVYNVAGSMNAWVEAGYPVQPVKR
ncbi:rhodanese-like domain-containing protein [Candidatus Nitrospira bockiana]